MSDWIMNYHMIKYDKSKGTQGYYIQKGGVSRKFEEEDIQSAIEYYKNKLSFANREYAKYLEDGLNGAILGQKANYNKMLEKVIKKLTVDRPGVQQLIANGFIGTDVNLTLMKDAARNYSKQFIDIARDIMPDRMPNGTTIDSAIRKMESHLNTLRGDIFEYLTAALLENALNQVKEINDSTLAEFINNIGKNIKKYSGRGNPVKIEVKGQKYKNIKVTGSAHKPNIVLNIGEEANNEKNTHITITGAQGKTDVTITGLSGDISSLGLSDKNYKDLKRRISFVSSANVPGLIALWPDTDKSIKNLALNSLSGRDSYKSSFKIMKSVFLVQAMAGSISDNILSSFIVVSTRDESHPIRVLSIYQILFADTKAIDNFNGSFEVDGMPIRGGQDGARSEDDFLEFLNSAKLSIKSNMALSKMIKLYNS